MIPIVAVVNLVFCILGLFVSLRGIRSGKAMLLPIYLALYIITNGIGISFAFIPAFNQLIWRSMYETMVTDKDFLALAISTWIFIIAASLPILRNSSQRPQSTALTLELSSDISIGLSLILVFIGFALYAKFMFFGPGLNLALTTSYFHYSFDAAYRFRGELDAIVTKGQGLLMATIASFCLFPLATFFAIVSQKTRIAAFFIGGICFVASFLFAYLLRQKAPVLLMLLLYVLIYVHFFRGALLKAMISRMIDGKMIVLGFSTFFLMLAVFYQITEGETVTESLVHSVYRMFIIPVASNQAWFVVFPEVFPFRGLIGIFDTIFFDPTKGSTGVQDVSEVITGYQFSLNAAMLAVAWSAAGYFGVAAISGIFCGIATAIDRAMLKLDSSLLYPIVIVSLPSLLSLTSTSFFDFVMKGGFIGPMVIVCSYHFMAKKRLFRRFTPGSRLGQSASTK